MQKQDYYNNFFEIGQQKINFSFFELSLPDDDPVYTLKKVLEELDFSGLLACYSDKGRTGFNPIMLYSVVTYANMRGVRAVDRICLLYTSGRRFPHHRAWVRSSSIQFLTALASLFLYGRSLMAVLLFSALPAAKINF